MWAQDLEAAASDFWVVVDSRRCRPTVIATKITRRHFVVLACWAVGDRALISLALATFRGIDTSAATAQEGGGVGTPGPELPRRDAGARAACPRPRRAADRGGWC